MTRFRFCTLNGHLYDNGKSIAVGYSGHEQGRNAPEFESLHNIGPIPRGLWVIGGPPYISPTHGPYVLRLTPAPGTESYGRGGFLIHGERMAGPPGLASEGCIILDRETREAIWLSEERTLLVVAVPPEDEATPAVA